MKKGSYIKQGVYDLQCPGHLNIATIVRRFAKRNLSLSVFQPSMVQFQKSKCFKMFSLFTIPICHLFLGGFSIDAGSHHWEE